ncbi:hypothetical protein [Nocardia sp. CA-290969]|uniref:hypothetical protein n=1 Tax=Nocardia sp. CA-290969 TaxID=3239986 RepID=UPI003D91C6AC
MTSTALAERPAYPDWPTLTGRQEPEHLSEFEGDDKHGLDAVELGRRCRKPQMPWQVSALLAILRMTAGAWTHPDVCLIVPRQNGKTLILVIRCLFGLFVLGERIIYSSQRWPTAEDAYKRLWAIIVARPSLRRRVVKNTCSQGMGYIELKSGAKIAFITRSNDAGRGLDEVDLVVYDEAYNLTGGQIDALSWTQMASRNPQTIYASSAVNADKHPNGLILAGVRRRGLAGDEGLYFAEFAAPEDMPRDSLETARMANPSYGVIQTDAKIRKALRGCTNEERWTSYGVEALGWGQWPAEEEDHEAVIDPEVWSDMTETAPSLRGQIALALDRTPDGRYWALAAAQATTDGRTHLEIGYFQSATHDEAIAYLLAVVEAWDPCVLVIDRKSPAAALEAKLLAVGIEPEMTAAPQMAVACQGFYDDAVASLLSHTGQKILTDAVATAAKRIMPGGDWAWDRTAGGVIAPLVAATLARWGLLTFGLTVSPPASPSTGSTTTADRPRSSGELDVFAAAF